MALPILSLFVVSLGYGVVVPLLPQLAGGREATSEGGLALVFAAYSAAKILFQLPGGVWADRIGAETMLRLGMVGFCLSLAGFLLGQDLYWFTFVRVVEGAATGLVYPAAFALVAQHTAAESMGRRMGLAGAIGTSGMLVGPAMGGLLAPLGVHVPVVAALGVALGCTLWAFAGRFSPRKKHSTTVIAAPGWASQWHMIASLSKNIAFVALLLPVGFNKLTYSAFQGLLPLYGVDGFGLSVQGITALFIMTGVGFALAQGMGGILADKLGARPLVFALVPLQLVALALMAVLPGLWVFVLLFGIYVLSASMIFTAIFKYAAESIGSEGTQGRLFGVLGTLTDTMVVLGPLIFLNLYGAVHGWTFLAMAVVGLLFFMGHGWFASTPIDAEKLRQAEYEHAHIGA